MIESIDGSYLIENEASRLLVNTNWQAAGGQIVQNGNGVYDEGQIWKLELAQ